MNNSWLTQVGLVFSLSLMVSAAEIRAQQTATGNDARQTADLKNYQSESHADDGLYLRDQLDMELTFGPEISFVLSARPGELIYINKPLGNGKELRLALSVMPVRAGENPMRRVDLKKFAAADIGFRIMPYCLNPIGSVGDKEVASADTCIPRRTDDLGPDYLVPIVPHAIRQILRGDSVLENLTGAQLKLIAYRDSGYKSFQQYNPYSKCCQSYLGVEVCSCSVFNSQGGGCNEGCPVSDEMKTELEN